MQKASLERYYHCRGVGDGIGAHATAAVLALGGGLRGNNILFSGSVNLGSCLNLIAGIKTYEIYERRTRCKTEWAAMEKTERITIKRNMAVTSFTQNRYL